MKTGDDCEVLVLPKSRGGAVYRMSADAYADELLSRSAVFSRSLPRHLMVEGGASPWDAYVTAQLQGLSAILWAWSQISLEHWACWVGISAAPAAPVCPPTARRRR